MDESRITHTDVEGLANKLDGLRHQLTDQEHETLQVVFRLAGSSFSLEGQRDEAPEVEGFKMTPHKAKAGNEQICRSGLFAQFSLGLATTPSAPAPIPLPYPNIG